MAKDGEGGDVLESESGRGPGSSGDGRETARASLSADQLWWSFECFLCLALVIYLLGPWRWIVGDLICFSLAVLALTLWPSHLRPAPIERRPSKSAVGALLAFSALSIVALWAYGSVVQGRSAELSLILIMAACYGPFAYLQQLAVQGYLTLRWGRRWGRDHPWFSALAAGLLFSLCHCNCPVLVPPTFVAGVAWARFYLATGQLLPLATSHAVLGATIFVFVVGKNPFAILWGGAETLGAG